LLCAPFTLIALQCSNPLPTAQASDRATAQSYVPIGQSQVLVWCFGQELRVRHRTSLREDHRPEPLCGGGRRSATRLMYKTFCGCFVLGLFRAGSNRSVIDERTKRMALRGEGGANAQIVQPRERVVSLHDQPRICTDFQQMGGKRSTHTIKPLH
jgi:hypothetical protein